MIKIETNRNIVISLH